MTLLAVVLFWTCLALLAWAHLLFPAALRLVAPLVRRPVARAEHLPGVTLVIAAANEEKHIRAKIDDCLRLDYPADRLEILVVSDASTDRTDDILASVGDRRVRTHRLPVRGGKAAAQNAAAALARHEVLFFTDATTLHPPDTLRVLLRSLADPSVGCVTGRPLFRRDAGAVSRGQETRFAFEMGMRGALGEVYSLLGAQDCVYAVPRERYRPVRPDLDSGFVGPLLVLEEGHRTVYEPDALAYVDRPPPGLRSEFARRSRIVLRGLRGLIHLRRLLNPLRHPFLATALVSTRLLRWLTPVFLVLLLAANLVLLDRGLYRVTLALQAFFYAAAAGGAVLAARGKSGGPLLALPFYFCLLAASAAAGLARLVRGETGQTWTTAR